MVLVSLLAGFATTVFTAFSLPSLDALRRDRQPPGDAGGVGLGDADGHPRRAGDAVRLRRLLLAADGRGHRLDDRRCGLVANLPGAVGRVAAFGTGPLLAPHGWHRRGLSSRLRCAGAAPGFLSPDPVWASSTAAGRRAGGGGSGKSLAVRGGRRSAIFHLRSGNDTLPRASGSLPPATAMGANPTTPACATASFAIKRDAWGGSCRRRIDCASCARLPPLRRTAGGLRWWFRNVRRRRLARRSDRPPETACERSGRARARGRSLEGGKVARPPSESERPWARLWRFRLVTAALPESFARPELLGRAIRRDGTISSPGMDRQWR